MEFQLVKKHNFEIFSTSWNQWWFGLSIREKTFPLFLGIFYPICIFLLSRSTHLGGLKSDHFMLTGVAILLWYLGPRLRSIFYFLLPLLLVAIVYDSMRYYSDLIRGTIHVSEPHRFDQYFFGINTPVGRLTPNEWFQTHTHPFLDVISGFFYLFFIPIYVLISGYFRFWIVPNQNLQGFFHPMWAFFLVNVLGYSTYYWYAAAPPWYFAEYGDAPANLHVMASAAGAVRFDAVFGTHFFSGMYGRAADVFGAVPSLHVAYPLQAVFYAFKYKALRVFSLIFYFMMCFSAIYLNHHYVLDILWGSTYALMVCMGLELCYPMIVRDCSRMNWET